ncbi:MAG: hypothetical protein H7321_02185 [Bacteroidia bacterium]|nr:hypothetical protein [Bacteroidia bacterium]
MKHILAKLVCIVVLSGTISLKAQDSAEKKIYSLKGYMTASYGKAQEYDRSGRLTYEASSFNLFNPTAALNVQKANGKFWEFQLNRMSINAQNLNFYYYDTMGVRNNLGGGRSISNSFAFTIEYGREIWKEMNKKTRFFISGGVLPYYSHVKSHSNVTPNEVNRYSSVGLNFLLVPRILIPLKNRFSIDINVPLNFAEVAFSNHANNSQTDFNVNVSTIPLRFGLAYRL